MNEPIDVVKGFVRCSVERRIADAVACLDPEFQLHHNSHLPYAGEYRGHDGYLDLKKKMAAYWERFEPGGEAQYVPDGESAVVVIGELGGKPSHLDESIRFPVVERYEVRDGRVAEIWVLYVDTKLTPEQAG